MTNGKCGWQYIANQGQCGCEAIYGEIVQTKHAAKTGQNLHVFMARADRSVSPRAQLLCEVTWQAHSHVGDADAEV